MTNESHRQPNLGDLVRAYYEHNELPEASLRRLMAEPRPRSSALRRWVVAGAIAATLAWTVVGLGVIRQGTRPALGSRDSTVAGPELVAVQIHADWCARSPEVAPIFAELLSEYGNEPMLFVTLDITDDVRREQAKLLARTLGIPQAFDEPFESGMIKLIDRRSHTLLAAITGREQAGELEFRIAEVLGVDPEDRVFQGNGA